MPPLWTASPMPPSCIFTRQVCLSTFISLSLTLSLLFLPVTLSLLPLFPHTLSLCLPSSPFCFHFFLPPFLFWFSLLSLSSRPFYFHFPLFLSFFFLFSLFTSPLLYLFPSWTAACQLTSVSLHRRVMIGVWSLEQHTEREGQERERKKERKKERKSLKQLS